jgi:hypothetical protein
MWGPKEYKTIELDGKPFAVTEPLASLDPSWFQGER